MRSVEMRDAVSLSSVKPLEGLLRYRAFCLSAVREALQGPTTRRARSPVTGARLEPWAKVEGLTYLRCPESGSLFLADLPDRLRWARLVAEVIRYRHSANTFHAGLAQSRTEHVYAPKLEWIEDTLSLQDVRRPRLLEVTTAPSDFTPLLNECRSFADIRTIDESTLSGAAESRSEEPKAHAAILLESLDRSHDPEALVRGVLDQLVPNGLLFVTALVCSGFDVAVLGPRNLYLCPPDRANCFSLAGLSTMLRRAGLTLLEVSTPGALDVEIVRAHLRHDPSIRLSRFEHHIVDADASGQEAFQTFLQQQGLSSFARMVARKPG